MSPPACLPGCLAGYASVTLATHTPTQTPFLTPAPDPATPCLPACLPAYLPACLPADDQPSAKKMIETFTRKFGLDRKPKYMFGISSGASFAVKFPGTMRIEGVISGERGKWRVGWWRVAGQVRWGERGVIAPPKHCGVGGGSLGPACMPGLRLPPWFHLTCFALPSPAACRLPHLVQR